MGGSRRGILRQAFGSFLAFAFVWAWHGGSYDTIFWFVPNWLGVAVEGWAAVFRKHSVFKNVQVKVNCSKNILASFSGFFFGVWVSCVMTKFLTGVSLTRSAKQRKSGKKAESSQ